MSSATITTRKQAIRHGNRDGRDHARHVLAHNPEGQHISIAKKFVYGEDREEDATIVDIADNVAGERWAKLYARAFWLGGYSILIHET